MSDFERMWRYARLRGGIVTGPPLPGPGMRAVVLALAEDTYYCSELARHLGYTQPPVSRWLRRLEQFELAEIDFVIQLSYRGGMAQFWCLTQDGREVAEALRAELAVAA